MPDLARDSSFGNLGRLGRLLQQREVRFSTPNLQQAQRHLSAQHDSIALTVRDPRSFRGYRELKLPLMRSIGLTLGCVDAANGYQLSFRSGDEMLVSIPLRGQGWIDGGSRTLEMAAGQILLVGPACHVTKHWQGPGEVLSLHVPLPTLVAAMSEPRAATLPLYLPPIAMMDHGRMHTLLAFVELLLEDAGQGALAAQAVAFQAEGLLLALLIEGLSPAVPSGAKTTAPSGSRPHYVARALNYMHANTGAEVNLDELAAVAGVSARTLQYGFHKSLGEPPMQHLKRLRLEQARDELRRTGQQRCRIGDVAASIGVSNVSQFSRAYRAMFGESPTETLSGPRRLCDGSI